MTKMLKSFAGFPIKDFETHLAQKDAIMAREARLIPTSKVGDENSLTSIFLSSLRLIKEFKKEILKNIGMKTGGKIHVFTEVSFKECENDRPDGLILIEIGGKIVDSALLEVKNGRNELRDEQVERYINIACKYKINKVVTISNQFVSAPTQSPLKIKKSKVALYHLSWSYIITIAHLLLFNCDDKIEKRIDDEDQVEIMREVVKYLEHKASGVIGFNNMGPGWKAVTKKIRSDVVLKKDDPDVIDTVESWIQEERDMALILSRELGLLVQSGNRKYKNNLNQRIDYEIKNLLEIRALHSTLQIKNVQFNLNVCAFFERKLIIMSVVLEAPDDITNKGKLGWLRKEMVRSEKNNSEKFNKIKDDLGVFVVVKGKKEAIEKLKIDELQNSYKLFQDKEIVKFDIRYQMKDSSQFDAVTKIVGIMEEMLIDFYAGFIQNVKPYQPSAPKAHDSSNNN